MPCSHTSSVLSTGSCRSESAQLRSHSAATHLARVPVSCEAAPLTSSFTSSSAARGPPAGLLSAGHRRALQHLSHQRLALRNALQACLLLCLHTQLRKPC